MEDEVKAPVTTRRQRAHEVLEEMIEAHVTSGGQDQMRLVKTGGIFGGFILFLATLPTVEEGEGKQ